MRSRREFKVIMLGDSAVGKTSILEAVTVGKFRSEHKATIGADFVSQEAYIEGKTIVLEVRLAICIFGTRLDRRGLKAWVQYSIEAHSSVCLCLTSLTQSQSFDSIQQWMALFKQNTSGQKQAIKIIVGNKLDLQEERKVDTAAIRQLLQKYSQVKYFEVSAKQFKGVKQLFDEINQMALTIMKNDKQSRFIPQERGPCKACLNRHSRKGNQKRCC